MLRKFVVPIAITLGTLIPALTATPASAGIILPPPDPIFTGDPSDPLNFNPYGNALVFGDFIVYSLPLLNYYATGDTSDPNPGDPYNVISTPGAIKDDIVVATGSSGTPVTTNAAGMDDAYPTPNTSAADMFQTENNALYPDPGGSGEFSGDTSDTWDITSESLLDYLGGDQLIFFFNLNDTNAGEGLVGGQDLLARIQITMYDGDGGTADPVFDLLDPFSTYDGIGEPGFLWDDWVFTHGKICVGEDGLGVRVFIHLGQCDADTIAFLGAAKGIAFTNTATMNQNLGADTAAFAVISPGLEAALAAGWTLQANINLGFIDNGFEQIFIQTGDRVTIPEPATLGIMGMGLLGMGLIGKARSARRQRRS